MQSKYRIRLPMGPPQYGLFSKYELDSQKECGCDGFMYVSILWPEDGHVGMSVMFAGMDGRTQKPLGDDERFKVLCFLAEDLAKSKTLGAGRKMFCQEIINTVRSAMGHPTRGCQ